MTAPRVDTPPRRRGSTHPDRISTDVKRGNPLGVCLWSRSGPSRPVGHSRGRANAPGGHDAPRSERCAASRGRVSPAQPGWTRKEVHGSTAYPTWKHGRDREHAVNAVLAGRCVGEAPQDPRDMVKVRLPESQSPLGVFLHPPVADALPAPRCAPVWRLDEGIFRDVGDGQRGYSRGCVGDLPRARTSMIVESGIAYGRRPLGHGGVRRESRLSNCAARHPSRPHLLSHQQYPTRKCGEVTNRVKPSDNVPTPSRPAPRPRGRRCTCQRQAERG